MDITDQKEAAGRLEQERALLRTLIDLLPDYIYVKDAEGRFLVCNSTCARFMGAPSTEVLLGKSDADFYPADLAAQFQRDDNAVIAGQRLIGKEEEFTRPDGGYQVIQTTKVPLTDAAGNIVGLVGAGRDITAFKLAEVALQKSEARLQLATEVGQIGIFEHNHRTNEFHPSPLLVELEGIGESRPDRFELLREYMHPEDWEVFWAKVTLARSPAGTGRLDNEHRIRNAAGEYRWMRVQTQTWFEGDGETRHAQRTIGTVMDITERKQAEERLLMSELQFRALVEQSLVGVYRIQEGRYSYVNPRLAEIFGYTEAEMLALPGVICTVMPKDRERVEENMARRNRGEIESLHYHFTGLRADGLGVELEAFGSRSVINGQPAIIGTILDITARRQAEAQLLIQTTALDAAANGIVITNVDGRILWVNKAFTRITGYAAAEAVGGKPSLLKSGQQDDDFYREMWTTILRGEVWRGELCNRRKDGGLYTEDMTITPVLGPEGAISHFIAIKQDITARKQADVALRESEELFREMAETIDEVFWVFEPASQRTIYASPAFEKIWGRTLANLYATSLAWAEPIHPEDRARVLAAFAAGIVRGSYEEQYRVVRADGSVRWVRDRGFPIRDARGSVTRMVGIAEDITERHRIEEQFRQAQKLEAIGTLAGGIAHDFNNILAAIIGFTELARMRVKDNPVVSEYLSSVMQGSERAVALVRQILTFSRGQEQAKRPLQLKQIVSESLRLMRATIPASIAFEVELPGNLPSVLADPTQVQQVVMNLCTNASHAMKNRSGRLGVKLEHVAVDNLTAAGHPGLRPGPYVRLTISDTGHGMTDATKKRIFEPFFTTKGPGEGTGLGLSVVHGIMQSYGGVITVYSEPEIGTTFHLYFLAQATALGDPAASAPDIPKGHGERILLVDDEKPIVQMSQQVLTDLGYRAECRTSAVAALEAVRADPAAYDLVITDLTMPEMTGVDLARQLLDLRPDLRIILSTGFSATLTPERARAMGIRDLLLKPHTVQSLALAVHRALSGSNP